VFIDILLRSLPRQRDDDHSTPLSAKANTACPRRG